MTTLPSCSSGRQVAEARLGQARDNQPLAYALVMAALSWDQVDQRGWRSPAVLCAQTRRLMAVWGIPTESVGDVDRVGAALEWVMQDPALVECDGQGSYRCVWGGVPGRLATPARAPRRCGGLRYVHTAGAGGRG